MAAQRQPSAAGSVDVNVAQVSPGSLPPSQIASAASPCWASVGMVFLTIGERG